MVGLLDLDENLLDLIFNYLDPSDLLDACLTSYGQPLVVSLNEFLDVHPDCGRACRTLELIGCKPDPLYEGDEEDITFPLECDDILEEDQILVQPIGSKSDVQYISLISRFKSLRYLGLGIQFQGLALKLDASFRSLRHFEFLGDGDELGEMYDRTDVASITPDLFQSIFQLPSIGTVDVDVPSTQSIPLQLHSLAQAPTLSSLTLGFPSLLDGEEVANLLAKTPNLKVFHFEFYENRERVRGLPLREHLSVDQISKALLNCTSTLEVLEFDIYWGDGDPCGGEWSEEEHRINFGPEGTLCDLKQMICLRRLAVPLAILVGLWPEKALNMPNILPPNIRYLCISDDMAHWLSYQWTPAVLDAHLARWIPDLRQNARLLETFVLEVSARHQWLGEGYLTDENPDLLYSLCAGVGIKGVVNLGFEIEMSVADSESASDRVSVDSLERDG
ncbi:MAG: hypothetical protein M1820_007228 [Bogoriella megaspora]|nr:MAG: hypothetical protein M1820_007228 [Bogoriella megaspora]